MIKAICIAYSNKEDNPSSLRLRVECEHKIYFDTLVRGIKYNRVNNKDPSIKSAI